MVLSPTICRPACYLPNCGAGGGFIILAAAADITNLGMLRSMGGDGSGGVIYLLGPNVNSVGGTLMVTGGTAGVDRGTGNDAGSGAAMGDRGGDGGVDGSAPTAGSAGVVIRSQMADPDTLFH